MNLPRRQWRWIGSAQPRASDTWLLNMTLCQFEYRLTVFIPKWRIVIGWQYLLVRPTVHPANEDSVVESYQYGD